MAQKEKHLEQVDTLLVTNHEAEFARTSLRPASAEVAPLEHTCEQMRDEDAVARSSTESLNQVRPVCLMRPQAMKEGSVSVCLMRPQAMKLDKVRSECQQV